MEIYLIRHTTPDVAANTCYGQADLDVIEDFANEAAEIKAILPAGNYKIYSSPLIRCKKLAQHLFNGQSIEFVPDLMEINCGDWELKCWDDIDRGQLKNWMSDYEHIPFPRGENFIDFNRRVISWFTCALTDAHMNAALITHAGVIRSVMAHITNMPIQTVFNQFQLRYGTVIRLTGSENNFSYEVLR